MQGTEYIRRRGEIQQYFDATALEAWKRLTGTEKVSGIRATVRAGRTAMREAILSRFPSDLTGWRILDAGCGAGQMALALAQRGAHVVGVDLSPEMIRHARAHMPVIVGGGSLELHSGDMLDASLGEFDGIVAMDSIIHYQPGNAVEAIAGLAARTRRRIVFTHAPLTPMLAAMHFAGRLFPRRDRAPQIVPVAQGRLIGELMFRPELARWQHSRLPRVHRGFYISQAHEVTRT